jgi:hypothetical protein
VTSATYRIDSGVPAGMFISSLESGDRAKSVRMTMTTKHGNRRTRGRGTGKGGVASQSNAAIEEARARGNLRSTPRCLVCVILATHRSWRSPRHILGRLHCIAVGAFRFSMSAARCSFSSFQLNSKVKCARGCGAIGAKELLWR